MAVSFLTNLFNLDFCVKRKRDHNMQLLSWFIYHLYVCLVVKVLSLLFHSYMKPVGNLVTDLRRASRNQIIILFPINLKAAGR
jgi:hypothetical protein